MKNNLRFEPTNKHQRQTSCIDKQNINLFPEFNQNSWPKGWDSPGLFWKDTAQKKKERKELVGCC